MQLFVVMAGPFMFNIIVYYGSGQTVYTQGLVLILNIFVIQLCPKSVALLIAIVNSYIGNFKQMHLANFIIYFTFQGNYNAVH